MSNKVVYLGGTAFHPTTIERSDSILGTQLRMANGSLRFFKRGTSARWTLTWENIPETNSEVASAIAEWLTVGVMTFTDEYGINYNVIVTDQSGHERSLEAANISISGNMHYSVSISFETT